MSGMNIISRKLITSFIVSIMVLLPPLAFASGDILQRKIVEIISSNEILSKNQHDEFWQIMENTFTSSQQKSFTTLITSNLDNALSYQEAMYDSMIESFIKQKVVRTTKLKSFRKKLEQEFIDSIPHPRDSKEFNETLAGWKNNNQADKNLTLMLEASANRKNLVMPGRGEFEITEENLRAVRNSITFKMHKLKKLLNPDWII